MTGTGYSQKFTVSATVRSASVRTQRWAPTAEWCVLFPTNSNTTGAKTISAVRSM